ncbi:MAG: RES family NAD+ phosphorylase, partial [Candidatus Eremiobacteraeota bacterium]|nr:RES family NAD+ phosphorylase [Candidatus Eremiobacteraeota bacterium]
MVSALDWRAAYRIIPSLYPEAGIFDRVVDVHDLDVVLELEAATNPRVLDEAGELAMVRPHDRIAGAGTTPVMAAFTHTMPSRFSDGSYGVFYAAHDEATAIAET